MNYTAAQKQINEGKILLLYLLAGDEPLLMEDIVEALRSALVTDPSMESLLLFMYDAENAAPEPALAEIKSGAFFDLRKLCIIKNLAAEPEDAGDWTAALRQYAGNPNPGAVVVVIAPGEVKAGNPLRTAFEAAGAFVDCRRLRGGDHKTWVAAYLAARGKHLSRQASWALETISGPSLGILKNELDKIVAYVGERENVEAGDIEAVCSDTSEIRVFSVTDAITAGDPRTAVQKMDQVLGRGEPPLRFMGLLIQTMRNVARAKRLLATMSRAQATKALGLHEFAASKSIAAAGKIAEANVEPMYEMLLQADKALKTGRDAVLTLDALVLELAGLFS